MKKFILISALAVIFCAKAKAQTAPAPDTTKVITVSEASVLFQNTDKALRAIHRVHIDALTRDSIDSYLVTNANFLNSKASLAIRRAGSPAVKVDSAKLATKPRGKLKAADKH